MKTENFDDAIRNKLDSIKETYTDEDIDKVHGFVNRNRDHNGGRRRYAYLAAASIAGLLITGLFAWNLVQHQQYKELAAENERLKKEVKDKSQQTVVRTETITKTDTVFVPKYVEVKPDAHEKVLADKKSDKPGAPLVSSNDTPAKNREKGSTQDGAGITSKAGSTSVDKTIADSNKNSPGKGNTGSSSHSNSNNTGNDNKSVQKDLIPESNTAQTGKDQKDKTQVPPGEELIADERKKVNDSTAAIVKKDTTQVLVAAEDSSSGPEAPKAKKHQWNLGIKDVDFAAGITTEFAPRQFGWGISADVKLNSRWSLSAGLRVQSLDNETYRDPMDFRYRRGTEFRDWGHVPDTTMIKNIGMHTRIIQLPVSVNYHIPLKNNWELFMGVGTDIDLYVRQHIDFDAHPINMPPRRRVADTEPDPKTINNLVLMAGVQKDWKKLSFQLNPFVSPQLTPVTYKREDFYAGVRFRLLYNFGS